MNWKSLKHEPPPTGMEVRLLDSRTGSIRMMPCEWGIGSVGENWSHWIQYTPPAPEPEKEKWELAWEKVHIINPLDPQKTFKLGWDARGGVKQ